MDNIAEKDNKSFVKPEIQVISFEGADVITESSNWGEWDWNNP